MKTKLSLALAAALFALPLCAFAQDEAAPAEEEASSPLTWNLSLTSSYMFRGQDLTDDKPALQGGLDFALDNGLYIGTWGSNLEYGADGPDIEIDTYIGWNHDLNDDWNLDLMAARYNYFGERDSYGNIEYNEYFARLGFRGLVKFTVAYTDSYVNSGETGMYYAVSSSKTFGDYTFDTSVGQSTFGDETVQEDFVDWSVGVSRSFGPVYTTLMYTDTDKNNDTQEDKIVLTFKISG